MPKNRNELSEVFKAFSKGELNKEELMAAVRQYDGLPNDDLRHIEVTLDTKATSNSANVKTPANGLGTDSKSFLSKTEQTQSIENVASANSSNSLFSHDDFDDAAPVLISQRHKGHRFDVIRHHAKGGLGKISVAMDRELNREVAVKEILGKFQRNQNVRTRFNIEALITGSLEHPCVVPVYGYGQHTDGSPWFAMRLIKGETLRDEIKRWHKEFGLSDGSSQSRLDFRNILSRFIDACQAIGYANSRGVLHRDIKPSNIMLGKYGETLVVDWGLAKKIDRIHPADPTSDDEASIMLDSSDTASTMDGSSLGTPAFMSPEQAAGRLNAMGPTSDIFSLGATLYIILTGRVAFDGDNISTVLENARQCKYIPPSQYNPSIPKPLSAICCRAMAVQPYDRYQSAMDLAQDVENWLADEPVAAYGESFLERTSRWLRRHRTAATVAGVLAITVAVLSAFGMFLVNAEKNRTVAALELVSKEKLKTEDALVKLETAQTKTAAALNRETDARRQTRDALNTITDDLVGELLARQIELGDADRVFFKRVLKQFSDFTKTQGDAVDAISIRAEGHFNVANLQRRLDDLPAAKQAYLKAESMFASLVEQDPQPRFRQDLAAINANLAILFAAQGRHRKAIEKEDVGIELLSELVQEFPDELQYQIELAKIRINRANAYTRLRELDSAEDDFKASVEMMKDLVQRSNRPELEHQYAGALTSFANFYASGEDGAQKSAELYRQAIDVLSDNETAENHKAETQLAFARQNYGNILLRLKKDDKAIRQFRSAIDTQTTLTERYPSLAAYRRDLGRSKLGLSRALTRLKLDGGERELDESIKLIQALIQQFPNRVDFRQDHALAIEWQASVSRTKNDIKATSDHYRDAIKIREQISDMRPENEQLLRRALGTRINFSNYLRTAEQFDDAIVEYENLMKYFDDETDADDPWLRLVRFGLADSLMNRQRFTDAMPLWTALTADDDDSDWAVFEVQRAICLIRGGDVAKGIAAAESALESKPGDGVTLYDTASCYAVAAEMEPEKIEQYTQNALDKLRQGRAVGFFSAAMRKHAETDSEMDTIRSQKEFKEFMSSLNEPSK